MNILNDVLQRMYEFKLCQRGPRARTVTLEGQIEDANV